MFVPGASLLVCWRVLVDRLCWGGGELGVLLVGFGGV